MKLKVLLINPWIYDFAAVNMWARPLGLLKVAEFLSAWDVELALVDCMDAGVTKRYGCGNYPKEVVGKPPCLKAVPRKFGRYGISPEEFTGTILSHGRPDLVLVTSVMSYWYPGVQRAIEIVRESYGGVPVILGGIYASLWSRHAVETSGADGVYKGAVGDELRFFLQTFGFRIRRKREKKPYYSMGLCDHHEFAPLLTTEGCPYNCAYCASSLLSPDFSRRKAGEVVSEIMDLYNVGIRDFAFYDDALLVSADDHLKAILKEVVGRNLDVRFHCPNGLHARFIDDELARLMKLSGFRTLRLSLETVDRGRQALTGGKVTSRELEKAVALLRRHKFTKEETGVYVMYGLPGQELREVREGVSFLKSLGVKIFLTELSPIPGTRCWDELVSQGIITESIDPLLTNNTVFCSLFSGYDLEELESLKLDVKGYNLEAGTGASR